MVGGGSLPSFYRRSGELALANYDYTDIAEGTGIIKFYGTCVQNTSTKTYKLVRDAIPSDVIETFSTDINGSFTKEQDLDFDVTFNIPKTIKGNMKFSIPVKTNGGNPGGSNQQNMYCVIYVYHYDGTTETQLGTTQTATYTNIGGTNPTSHEPMMLASIEISQKQFKKGETLRVTIEGWTMTTNTSGTVKHAIGHDPASRLSSLASPVFSGSDETNLTVYVPFVIDTT